MREDHSDLSSVLAGRLDTIINIHWEELQQGQLEAEQARHGDIVQVRLQYRVKPVRSHEILLFPSKILFLWAEISP